MGTDAILVKDGKEVAWLGRLSQFTKVIGYMDELDTNVQELENRVDSMSQELLTKIQNITYFIAGKKDLADELELTETRGVWEKLTKSELYDILFEDIEQFIEYFTDEMINIGKKEMLAGMLEDNKELQIDIDY